MTDIEATEPDTAEIPACPHGTLDTEQVIRLEAARLVLQPSFRIPDGEDMSAILGDIDALARYVIG